MAARSPTKPFQQVLEDHGFQTVRGANAWREWPGGIDVVEVKAHGPGWGPRLGCPPGSFSIIGGVCPFYLLRDAQTAAGQLRAPHCPLRYTLPKTLSQPWFTPHGREPSNPVLKDRSDIWYFDPDREDAGEVLRDAAAQLASALLPWMDAMHAPQQVLEQIQRRQEGRNGVVLGAWGWGMPGSAAANRYREAVIAELERLGSVGRTPHSR